MLTNRQLFFKYLAQTSEFPLALEIESAEGIYMYGPHGEKYLDLISGIGVSNVGHRHPEVVAAIKNQVDKYMHLMVYGEVIQSPQVQLAGALAPLLPWRGNSSVYFVNSGSEAVEGAIKLAKRYTGKTEIISCKNAYHGSSHGSLSLMGNEEFKQAFRPLLPGVRHITFNSVDDLTLINENTACVIIEPIQGEAGIRLMEGDYINQLRNKCYETGTLLIFDEIQSGFGRTGKFFCYEHYNVEPDILVMAKGMGGGMPIGAFASSKEIMQTLTNNPLLGHITTFGGNPVCCAASMATLQIILDNNLHVEAYNKGELFKQLLKHPAIKEVRGVGLLMATQLDNFDNVQKIIDGCIKRGLFTDWFLFCDSALRIAPPLIITEDEIRWAAKTLLTVLDEVYQ